MKIPDWLKHTEHRIQDTEGRKTKEKFLDRTLRHIVSFTEDIMFNEMTSSKNGFLQKIEPRIKVLTILLFIVILSLQKSLYAISAFFFISSVLALLSRIPPVLFIQRLLPAFLFTLFIAAPAALNLIVKGEPLITLYNFKNSYSIGSLMIPQEISITKQGLSSAIALILRATASVSLVFLLTLTTPPNKLIKTVSSFMPGAFKSIVSMSYRYIFFLVRKIEQFIMGFRSRNISSVSPEYRKVFGGKEQRWVASRMSLLFSISLKLSAELEQAMVSRGYDYNFKVQSSKFKVSEFSRADIIWLIFSVIFMGAMLWKSLT